MACKDISNEMHERLSEALYGFVDAYEVQPGEYQVEVFGKASRTERRLELAGFVVTGRSDDYLDDQPYALVMFRDKQEV
jgi:hypothetical protein